MSAGAGINVTHTVLTIVAGRGEHLHRQAVGLCRCNPLPDRWIIVGMNQDAAVPRVPGGYAFDVRTDRVDDPEHLPLAAGRNRAAAAATALSPSSQLIFFGRRLHPRPIVGR